LLDKMVKATEVEQPFAARCDQAPEAINTKPRHRIQRPRANSKATHSNAQMLPGTYEIGCPPALTPCLFRVRDLSHQRYVVQDIKSFSKNL
jgi:hypothetical protein